MRRKEEVVSCLKLTENSRVMRGVKGKRHEYIFELSAERRVGWNGVVSVMSTRVSQ